MKEGGAKQETQEDSGRSVAYEPARLFLGRWPDSFAPVDAVLLPFLLTLSVVRTHPPQVCRL